MRIVRCELILDGLDYHHSIGFWCTVSSNKFETPSDILHNNFVLFFKNGFVESY
jgi:hypothetical protein